MPFKFYINKLISLIIQASVRKQDIHYRLTVVIFVRRYITNYNSWLLAKEIDCVIFNEKATDSSFNYFTENIFQFLLYISLIKADILYGKYTCSSDFTMLSLFKNKIKQHIDDVH